MFQKEQAMTNPTAIENKLNSFTHDTTMSIGKIKAFFWSLLLTYVSFEVSEDLSSIKIAKVSNLNGVYLATYVRLSVKSETAIALTEVFRWSGVSCPDDKIKQLGGLIDTWKEYHGLMMKAKRELEEFQNA